ncbi:MAG: hypothetical protein IJK62_10290 [Bacteroidales bacterium]|nr:hypothetical protein [Bacteroidales bacterium]
MQIFTQSEKMKEEYCASIVRVQHIEPVENSDNLVKTVIGGYNIVCNKATVNEGDVVIYCKNETRLNYEFLSKNNLFEMGSRELNSNYTEVQKLLDEGRDADAKKLVGFFNKKGRLKMIRLRGCPSMGIIFREDSLVRWNERFKDVKLEDYIDHDDEGNEIPFNFDTIDGVMFIKAYVPEFHGKKRRPPQGTTPRKKKSVKLFDRIIPEYFKFNYDTKMLNDNIWRFKPDDSVYITVKMHGTSAIFANVPTKVPKRLNPLQFAGNLGIRLASLFVPSDKRDEYLEKRLFPNYRVEYGNICSSRRVPRNRYIGQGDADGFYDFDIWNWYNEKIKDYIPEGMTVYGEVCGYIPDADTMFQSPFDYGCDVGKSFLMPYRITTISKDDGEIVDMEMEEVYKWTLDLIAQNPERFADIIKPVNLLYHGTLRDLYPDLDINTHWHEDLLEAMKNDSRHFGLEQNEPLCVSTVPREGIVIRKDGDNIAEAFKLKSMTFLLYEGKRIESGAMDSEMMEGFALEEG